MHPKVIKVRAIGKSFLYLKFNNGESGLFDVKNYWSSSFFSELKENSYFKKVHVWNGTVKWPNHQDFAPETLYLELIKNK